MAHPGEGPIWQCVMCVTLCDAIIRSCNWVDLVYLCLHNLKESSSNLDINRNFFSKTSKICPTTYSTDMSRNKKDTDMKVVSKRSLWRKE
jgi:hypothetical protein